MAVINGTNGNDVLTGTSAFDSMYGMPGNDTFVGSLASVGDAGDNSGFSVSSAGDVNGDGFDDLLIGARSAEPNGQDTADQVTNAGTTGNDSLTGTASNDILIGGLGNDALVGGLGQ